MAWNQAVLCSSLTGTSILNTPRILTHGLKVKSPPPYLQPVHLYVNGKVGSSYMRKPSSEFESFLLTLDFPDLRTLTTLKQKRSQEGKGNTGEGQEGRE